jgi:hypothetical protein
MNVRLVHDVKIGRWFSVNPNTDDRPERRLFFGLEFWP